MVIDIFNKPPGVLELTSETTLVSDTVVEISVILKAGVFNIRNDNVGFDFASNPETGASNPDFVMRQFLCLIASHCFVFDLVRKKSGRPSITITPSFASFDVLDAPFGGESAAAGAALPPIEGYSNLITNDIAGGQNVFDDIILPTGFDRYYAIPFLRYGNIRMFHDFYDNCVPFGTRGVQEYIDNIWATGISLNDIGPLKSNYIDISAFPPDTGAQKINFKFQIDVSDFSDEEDIVMTYNDYAFGAAVNLSHDFILYTHEAPAPPTPEGYKSDWVSGEGGVVVSGLPDGVTYTVEKGVNNMVINLDTSLCNNNIRNASFRVSFPLTRYRPPIPDTGIFFLPMTNPDGWSYDAITEDMLPMLVGGDSNVFDNAEGCWKFCLGAAATRNQLENIGRMPSWTLFSDAGYEIEFMIKPVQYDTHFSGMMPQANYSVIVDDNGSHGQGIAPLGVWTTCKIHKDPGGRILQFYSDNVLVNTYQFPMEISLSGQQFSLTGAPSEGVYHGQQTFVYLKNVSFSKIL